MNSEHTKEIIGGSGSGRKGVAGDVAICGYTDSCDSEARGCWPLRERALLRALRVDVG